MTENDIETTEEAESNQDYEMINHQYETKELQDVCQNREPHLLPSVSTQEVLSPILTKPGQDQRKGR